MTHPEQSEKRGRHESLTLSSLREGEGTPRASQDSNRVSSADSFNVTTPPVSFTVSDIISGGSATITPPLNELLIDKYVNQSASPSVRSINQSVCRSTIPSIIIDRSITRTTKTITNKTNLYTIKEATTQLAAKSRITRYLKCYALNEEERSRDPSIPSLSCSLRLSFFFFFLVDMNTSPTQHRLTYAARSISLKPAAYTMLVSSTSQCKSIHRHGYRLPLSS